MGPGRQGGGTARWHRISRASPLLCNPADLRGGRTSRRSSWLPATPRRRSRWTPRWACGPTRSTARGPWSIRLSAPATPALRHAEGAPARWPGSGYGWLTSCRARRGRVGHVATAHPSWPRHTENHLQVRARVSGPTLRTRSQPRPPEKRSGSGRPRDGRGHGHFCVVRPLGTAKAGHVRRVRDDNRSVGAWLMSEGLLPEGRRPTSPRG